ncbi:MAG: CpsB/CapC family capsule biosynthesis tyrosine phosphatase [Coprococcus sp.]
MIDIHNHLLPSFDDGSPTLDNSLDMAEIAAASGVDTVILTPSSAIYPDILTIVMDRT